MPTAKKKLNLTVNEDVLIKAKKLVEARGESLSQLVEDFLARLTAEMDVHESDWLERFHKQFLAPGFKEPTDDEVESIKQDRLVR